MRLHEVTEAAVITRDEFPTKDPEVVVKPCQVSRLTVKQCGNGRWVKERPMKSHFYTVNGPKRQERQITMYVRSLFEGLHFHVKVLEFCSRPLRNHEISRIPAQIVNRVTVLLTQRVFY